MVRDSDFCVPYVTVNSRTLCNEVYYLLSPGKLDYIVAFIDVWSTYCPTVCNHLCRWGQFFVHTMFHRNVTIHALYSPLPPSSLFHLEPNQ
jgi:hypothetical protein